MAWGGAQWFPQPSQSRVSPRKSLVLSRGGLSVWAALQPLGSWLGHDELLIAVLEQIGSGAQATPGCSVSGVTSPQPGSPAANAAGPVAVGSGPLEMPMLFPLQCGYSEPHRRIGMGLGTWALHGDLSQFKYF